MSYKDHSRCRIDNGSPFVVFGFVGVTQARRHLAVELSLARSESRIRACD